jgi:hypothetical protein
VNSSPIVASQERASKRRRVDEGEEESEDEGEDEEQDFSQVCRYSSCVLYVLIP